jgi:hypothetical protein
VGVPTDGVGAALGVSGGSPLPDRLYMHEGASTPDSHYALVGSPTGLSNPPGSCSGDICSTYFWEIATTNVRGLQTGHSIKGVKNLYQGKHYKAHSYHDPSVPAQNLIAQTIPVDDHGTYNNSSGLDQEPGCAGTTDVCDQNGTPGSPPGTGACVASYPQWGYNEFVCAENSVENTNAHHCDYGAGATACLYRFSHSFNTGTNWNFSVQNAISNVSQDGKWAIFASDWNRTLGCTNGWDGVTVGQICLDPITAGNTANITVTQVQVDGANNTTITATNTWSRGMYVKLTGLTSATWLNNKFLLITSVTGSSFVGQGVNHVAYGPTADTGNVNWAGCGGNLDHSACPRGDDFIVDLLSAH